MTMNDCLFCKIVRKEIPATVVHENDRTLCFMDIKPVNAGHMLVIPKKHFDDYASTSDEALREMAVIARRLGEAAMKALGAPGFNLAVNNGAAAGQLVGHVHLHVIPRFEGDGHELWHGKPYEEGEAQAVADKLKTALS
jgi:histidine triad (HIT) family protein